MKKWMVYIGIILSTACVRRPFSDEEHRIIGCAEDGIMPVYTIENPSDSLFLRKQALPLGSSDWESDLFQVLKQRMLSTVNDPANPGVGIAAPQVGISRRLVAVQRYDKPGEPFEFYINPEIIHYSEEKLKGKEGCLSVPDREGQVYRSAEIIVRYIEENEGKMRQDTVKGFTAVIFQHEIDHLQGILFIDRLAEEKALN